MIMKKEKLKGYESPSVNVLELRVEGIVCQSINSVVIASAVEDDWGEL